MMVFMKEGRKHYTRWCKRCDKKFINQCKKGKVCDDCNLNLKRGSPDYQVSRAINFSNAVFEVL